MQKSVPYFLVVIAAALLSSCDKKTNEQIIGCDPPVSNLPFQIVDKVSGEDLFFSNNPKHQLADFKVYKIDDKDYKEPLKLEIIGTGNNRIFLVPSRFSKPKDTMVFKIANTPDDYFIYNAKRSANHCEPDQITQLTFNNQEVTPANGIVILKK